jgi:hypothetical protein
MTTLTDTLRRVVGMVLLPVNRFAALSPRQQLTNGCAIAIGFIAVFGVIFVPASTNRIEVNDNGNAGDIDYSLTANDLRPEDCRLVGQDVQVDNVISGGEPIVGTAQGDLIFSDQLTTTIDSNDGDDCIIAGDAVTHIDGGGGTNVCIVDPAVVDVTNCIRVDPSL